MSLNEKMNIWHRNEESDNLDIKNPGEDEENADDSDYEADKESEANEDEIKEYVGYEADETEYLSSPHTVRSFEKHPHMIGFSTTSGGNVLLLPQSRI